MKTIKDYVIKLKFVFNEILKADPSIFFLSISSMVIAGISPVVVTYLSKRQTMRQSLKSTPPIIGDVASCIRPEDYLTMA